MLEELLFDIDRSRLGLTKANARANGFSSQSGFNAHAACDILISEDCRLIERSQPLNLTLHPILCSNIETLMVPD